MKKMYLGVTGLITGLISSLVATHSFITIVLAPGFIFGIGIIITFALIKQKIRQSFWKDLLFILSSAAGYVAAYFITSTAVESSFSAGSAHFGYLLGPVVGGCVGAFILLRAFQLLCAPLSEKHLYLLAALGGALGLSMFIPDFGYQFGPLFITWQTGMAFGLGWILDNRIV